MLVTVVFIGGGIGAVLRYGAGLLSGRCFGFALPGTFAVNMLGCLLLGVLMAAAHCRAEWLSNELRHLLCVGVLGALTTFSTFSFEIFSLVKSGRIACALGYWLVSSLLGFAATAVGYYAAAR